MSIPICDVNDCENFFEDGPLPEEENYLVFAIIVTGFWHAKQLKECRLVCKAWDNFACRALRNRTYVSLKEDSPRRYKEFQALLQNKESGMWTGISSPFRTIHIHAASFTQEKFLNLLSYLKNQENLFCKKLYLSDSRRFYYKNSTVDLNAFAAFLIRNRKTLTDISFSGRFSNFLTDDLIFNCLPEISNIRLLNLRKIIFNGSCILNARHSLFFGKLLHSCYLEAIEVDDEDDSNRLIPMIASLNLENLKCLSLSCYEVPSESWKILSTLHQAKLKVLILTIGDSRDARSRWPSFASMVSNTATSLEVLKASFIPVELLPTCPKLHEVFCYKWYYENKFGDFSPEKFPQLKTISFVMNPDSCCLEAHFEPHYGVERIFLKEGKRVSNGGGFYAVDRFREFLYITLTQLGVQFPNIIDLTISLHSLQRDQVLTASLFGSLCKSFPRLKNLVLYGMVSDFLSVSGILVDLNYWADQDSSVDIFPRLYSFQDFLDLETLDLGYQIVVTQDMLVYCLSRIPKLKRIKFFWNENLSAETICNSLGHLEKVQIEMCNRNKKTCKKELDRLCALLPSVVVT